MSVLNENVVDTISINPEGEAVLTIIDELSWSEDDHLLHLQNKINTYITFIESNEIYESYPKAQGKKLVINLVSKFEIDEDGVDFFNQVKPILTGIGVDFRYELFDKNKVGKH